MLLKIEFERLQRLPPAELASEKVYYQCVGLCTASSYAFCPQSRIKAINRIQMQDLRSAFETMIVSSEHSKTRQTYGPQMILFCPDTLSMWGFFVDKIRSLLVLRFPHLNLNSPQAFLFVSFRNPGTLAQVSPQLTSILRRIAGNNLHYYFIT